MIDCPGIRQFRRGNPERTQRPQSTNRLNHVARINCDDLGRAFRPGQLKKVNHSQNRVHYNGKSCCYELLPWNLSASEHPGSGGNDTAVAAYDQAGLAGGCLHQIHAIADGLHGFSRDRAEYGDFIAVQKTAVGIDCPHFLARGGS